MTDGVRWDHSVMKRRQHLRQIPASRSPHPILVLAVVLHQRGVLLHCLLRGSALAFLLLLDLLVKRDDVLVVLNVIRDILQPSNNPNSLLAPDQDVFRLVQLLLFGGLLGHGVVQPVDGRRALAPAVLEEHLHLVRVPGRKGDNLF